MSELLFELPLRSADRTPEARAIVHKDSIADFAWLGQAIEDFSAAMIAGLRVGKLERIAVYLPKTTEAVVVMFGSARAGCTFVPVNPLLNQGYPSIGCMPCTQPVAEGEDPRSGRWAGKDKTECGLHS